MGGTGAINGNGGMGGAGLGGMSFGGGALGSPTSPQAPPSIAAGFGSSAVAPVQAQPPQEDLLGLF